MRYTIRYRGVPVGSAEMRVIGGGRSAFGVVEALPGYETVRDRVRAETRSVEARGGRTGWVRTPAAFDREVELLDAQGAPVPTDFVCLAEYPWEPGGMTAWAVFREARAPVPAPEPPPAPGQALAAPEA